ncbi:MAG TPA: LemA family protein, partial [Gemmatimonadaceae bacterium]|nr:LemA family protein [Gemmatimonadaceae bacterium]
MRAMTMARPDTVRGARARWVRRAVLLLPLALGACGYNSIQTLDETAARSQKEIEVQLQRRADLIPNLVATVKGFAQQENDVLTQVTQA